MKLCELCELHDKADEEEVLPLELEALLPFSNASATCCSTRLPVSVIVYIMYFYHHHFYNCSFSSTPSPGSST